MDTIDDNRVVECFKDLKEFISTHYQCRIINEMFQHYPNMNHIEQIALFALKKICIEYSSVYVEAQQPIGNYRVDFLVVHKRNKTKSRAIIVECDGHNFHEKTKEQAARDKKRDRDLQLRGYTVLRFTGSEIWKTKGSCVSREVLKFISNQEFCSEGL